MVFTLVKHFMHAMQVMNLEYNINYIYTARGRKHNLYSMEQWYIIFGLFLMLPIQLFNTLP